MAAWSNEQQEMFAFFFVRRIFVLGSQRQMYRSRRLQVNHQPNHILNNVNIPEINVCIKVSQIHLFGLSKQRLSNNKLIRSQI